MSGSGWVGPVCRMSCWRSTVSTVPRSSGSERRATLLSECGAAALVEGSLEGSELSCFRESEIAVVATL
eukprot:scaffold288705_cov39-Tisochrysis_lutea.AAC.1